MYHSTRAAMKPCQIRIQKLKNIGTAALRERRHCDELVNVLDPLDP
jgi:hypothetical protein